MVQKDYGAVTTCYVCMHVELFQFNFVEDLGAIFADMIGNQ